MKHKKPFSIKKRLESFTYAFEGFKTLFLYEHNAKIHLLASLLVVLFAIYLKISIFEWIALLIVVGMVFCAEIFNSSIEILCDKISPEKDETIKKVKDLGAAAVLMASLVAIMVGSIIFIPKLMLLNF
jgi:diacylglycerol kinase